MTTPIPPFTIEWDEFLTIPRRPTIEDNYRCMLCGKGFSESIAITFHNYRRVPRNPIKDTIEGFYAYHPRCVKTARGYGTFEWAIQPDAAASTANSQSSKTSEP